jgi:hypothetical protein
MMNQQYFSREEIVEHLRAGTWESLRFDDRVCWSEAHGSTNMSVRSYLRRSGRRVEAHQLWDAQRAQR